MDHLKEGIGLRGYGQKDPLIEYKKESFTMFQDMMDRIEDETIRFLYFMRIDPGVGVPMPYPEPEDEEGDEAEEPELVAVQSPQRPSAQKEAQQSVLDLTRNIQRKKDRELAELQFSGGDGTGQTKTVSKTQKVGRNELCPCGSGKKYKKCHGVQA